MSKTKPAKMTFHLISNAHLDPVWLWDWREGLNQGLITCRTALNLMDENPELTFNRGEAAIYQHIEESDPETFARIARYVKAGRWDIVGGTWVQADQNLPAAETLMRHFTRGQQYFASRFGRKVEVAWSADCFGHAAGIPEIFAAAGIRYFAATRPDAKTLPLAKSAYWWVGPGGSRILAYRPVGDWYGSDRFEVNTRLNQTLERSANHGLQTVGIFYGLGDHGGGPTRRQIDDFSAWAKAHPEIRVVHSTMHRFFHALETEVRGLPRNYLPEVQGELNYVARGCYSTMAKLKFAYRKAESLVSRAETTQTAISLATQRPQKTLAHAWDGVLFNTFHDILPGTSIERAFDDQIAQLGQSIHQSQVAELAALNTLASQADTRVLPAAGYDLPTGIAGLVFNPHPFPFEGYVEFEGCMDDRPLPDYREGKGGELPIRVLDHRKKPTPFQVIPLECLFWLESQWRKRVVVPVKLPPLGWSVLEMGFFQGAPSPAAPAPRNQVRASGKNGSFQIANGIFRISAAKGAAGIKITRNGKPFLGGAGLGAGTFDDPLGSWGSGAGEAVFVPKEAWKIKEVTLLEQGPWRAALWVRLAGRCSRMDLTIYLCAGRDAVDVSARVHFDERSARLRLIFPVSGSAEFDVPAARVTRKPFGELPGCRWVRLADKSFGFASDALYSFNLDDRKFQVTVARATRYAANVSRPAKADPWLPATDVGEHKFRFVIAPGNDDLFRLSRELERPVTVQLVAAKPGKLPSQGSLLELQPDTLDPLALKPATDGNGCILRLQETTGKTVRPKLMLLGKKLTLPPVKAHQIASYRLRPSRKVIKVERCDAAEKPLQAK